MFTPNGTKVMYQKRKLSDSQKNSSKAKKKQFLRDQLYQALREIVEFRFELIHLFSYYFTSKYHLKVIVSIQ